MAKNYSPHLIQVALKIAHTFLWLFSPKIAAARDKGAAKIVAKARSNFFLPNVFCQHFN